MEKREFTVKSSDGITDIHVVQWSPENERIRGVVQIAHGITEHMGRYEEFAKYLTERGMVVIGNDHIGHGKSINREQKEMYFGKEKSWFYVTKDFYNLYKLAKETYLNLPYTILGFSLGSFVVRTFLIEHPEEKVDKVVLIGTGQTSKAELYLGKLMSKLESNKVGEDNYTEMIDKLALENYNKNFNLNRTKCDWLCSNEQAIDEYMDDMLVGKHVSCGLFRELLNGMLYTTRCKNIKKMNKKIPILLISGKDDAVGEFGKGIEKLEKILKKVGIKDITVKIYDGLRHDILHEKEYKEIYKYIYNWCVFGNDENVIL